MLTPALDTFEVTPEIRSKLQDHIFDALFDHVEQYPPS